MTVPALPLTLGPPSNPWIYTHATKTWDLSRRSPKKLSLSTTSGLPDTRFEIDPAISALVIVDMQNFFLSPECMHHPRGLEAVEPTIKVIEKCREVGIQIIWLNWGLTPEDLATMPPGVQRGFSKDLVTNSPRGTRNGLGADLGGSQGRTLCAGSWNADIFEPLKAHVRPGDVHCAKNRMSGLWSQEQPLWRHLDGEAKRTLLFTGVNTDQCVLGTLTNAYNAGWDCVLVDDACGTTTEGGREVCLHNIASSYGFVTNSASIVAAKIVEASAT